MDIIEIRAYLVGIFRNWPVEVDSWLLLPGSEYWVGIVIFRMCVFWCFLLLGIVLDIVLEAVFSAFGWLFGRGYVVKLC